MRRTFLSLLLAVGAGSVLGGGAAAGATANPSAASQCPQIPRWEVAWTSHGAETSQRCGPEAASAVVDPTGATGIGEAAGNELPLTGGPTLAVVAFAAALVLLGVGLYLVTRRRRSIFTV